MNKPNSLMDLVDQKLEQGDVELPVFDEVAQSVYKAAQSDKATAEEICALIQEDPILVSEVLRMANSSFFSGLAEITTMQDAVVRLGLKQLCTLVLSISQKRMYSASAGKYQDRLKTLWQHVSTTSLSARWIAGATGYRKLADEVHVAALLHDVGKLSLLRIIEELAETSDIPQLDELIDPTLDLFHCQHGAKLLEMWGVPQVYRDIVLQQEDEEFDDTNISLVIVRLANRACAKEGISDRPELELSLESLNETSCLGMDEIGLAELCIAIEDASLAA